ncbi:uncharacterized protein FOMMEDRAFT_146247 [Fomitiporia mediterranea MF3/22]|uniref:uncharacterized protein n=1 Tax=Fomitiporia mediterranea (strain MF3/22) TaxID=694068 RepID=UPI0004409A92|nr:uncharacterized protein FOMMEDRAFT_146247 [Fomitiporia mediterranea MF3/22]EJD04245.1 hypothetical protein FOMMEDRAFT_146247 [Fomitiporia mediterranea MF3/22]
MKSVTAALVFSLVSYALARPTPQTSSFAKQNGEEAIDLNNQISKLTPDSSCNAGENACVNQQFAQCVGGKFTLTPCAGGTICAALPLVNSPGTSVTCTTQADLDARIAATGATGGTGNGGTNNSSGDAGGGGNDSGANNGNKDGNNGGTDNGNNGGGNNSTDSGNNNGNSNDRGGNPNNGNNGGNIDGSNDNGSKNDGGNNDGSNDGSGNSNGSNNDGEDNNGSDNNGGNNSTSNNDGNNNGGGGNNNGDLQSSLCLDPSLVQKGFEKDGQQVPAQDQVASATSPNNFINFCATVKKPLTNGQQVKGGSCNAAPMGVIASTNNMPSAKFQSPKNLDKIQANKSFTVKLAIKNLAAGNFVNAADNYFSAPQNINDQGNIIGHSHVVIEKINGLSDTSVTDPTKFTFFKGLNEKAQNGVLSVDVTDGLPAGTYRMASINSAANHQPVLVAVAQHGSLDDMVYFTVTDNGN